MPFKVVDCCTAHITSVIGYLHVDVDTIHNRSMTGGSHITRLARRNAELIRVSSKLKKTHARSDTSKKKLLLAFQVVHVCILSEKTRKRKNRIWGRDWFGRPAQRG